MNMGTWYRPSPASASVSVSGATAASGATTEVLPEHRCSAGVPGSTLCSAARSRPQRLAHNVQPGTPGRRAPEHPLPPRCRPPLASPARSQPPRFATSDRAGGATPGRAAAQAARPGRPVLLRSRTPLRSADTAATGAGAGATASQSGATTEALPEHRCSAGVPGSTLCSEARSRPQGLTHNVQPGTPGRRAPEQVPKHRCRPPLASPARSQLPRFATSDRAGGATQGRTAVQAARPGRPVLLRSRTPLRSADTAATGAGAGATASASGATTERAKIRQR
jgi:hypothetical protein